jgi:1-acyl-sn-glycerol-3-phosphate acyltransferase
VGWRLEGELPPEAKAVVIAAPHTSWWDAVLMLAVAWSLRIRLSWMVKSGAFRWPFRRVLRWLGAVPVVRHQRRDTVEQLAARFERSATLYLAIAPAGTRAHSDHWKSGFYNIAHRAGVPIIPSFLDYGRRIGGVGPSLRPSGDRCADMDVLRAFYGPIVGLRPAQKSEVRLRDEDVDYSCGRGRMPGTELRSGEVLATQLPAWHASATPKPGIY